MISELLQKIAPQIGAVVHMEPEWGIAGQIIFKNGGICYFRGTNLGLNSLGASEISRDKGYAAYFMARMGYSTIDGQTFYSDKWCKAIRSDKNIDEAYQYAVELGMPIIVKPNSGSQGDGVCLVHDKIQFYRAMKQIFKHDKIAIVQRPVRGNDYRLVVVDDRIISAYQRIPLSVIGDGRSTIAQLLRQKQDDYKKIGRDTLIKNSDPRIAEKLHSQGLTKRSVPLAGRQVYLLDNANLSTGGDAVDVTGIIHPEFERIAVRLTRDMGLRLCGVDLMVEGNISEAPNKYWVLEVNAAPGLDHYAKAGKEQEKVVEELYLEVLKAMEEIYSR